MGLIGSLPGLTVMGYHDGPVSYTHMYLTNPDADIAQISLGLRLTGDSLTEIWLNGEGAAQQVVSDASMTSLCDVIRDQVRTLERFMLAYMTVDEDSLVVLIETCRAITTMKMIG